VLKERGILAHSPISLEHQHLAKRYVVRGLESGGAVGELGRYVTFTQEDGQPIEWLHRVEAIGVNGLHAIVVAPVLVRVEMLRKGQTYELLITQHRPGATNDGKRPPLETRLLFRGIHGRSDLDLSGKDKKQSWHGSADVLFARRRKSGYRSGFARWFAPSQRRFIATAVFIATMSGRRKR